jgi:hypothetical protein
LKLFDDNGALSVNFRGEVGDSPAGTILTEFSFDLIAVVGKIWEIAHHIFSLIRSSFETRAGGFRLYIRYFKRLLAN